MNKDKQAAYDRLKKIAVESIKMFDCPEPKKVKGKQPSYAYLKSVGERALQEVKKMEAAELAAEKKQAKQRSKFKIAVAKNKKTAK